MSYNGSGTFQINTAGQPVVTGTVISSTAFNALTTDLATGLSTAITKDGQTATTARIPFALGVSSTLVTDATSSTTGSIISAGGISCQKALNIGTALTVGTTVTTAGIINVNTATAVSDTNVFSADNAVSKVAVQRRTYSAGNEIGQVSAYIGTIEVVELDFIGVGANGGSLTIYTKPSGGALTSALTVSSAQAVAFPNITTTASAANAFLDSGGANNLLRSTSSREYKTDVQPIDIASTWSKVSALQAISYLSKAKADDPTKRHYGFIAEDVAAIDPQLVQYTTMGSLAETDSRFDAKAPKETLVPDGVQYERIIPILLAKIIELNNRLSAANI